MPPPIRVYIDTSVFGGALDEEFSSSTKLFFDRVRRGECVILLSQLILDEMSAAPARVQRILEQLPEARLERLKDSSEAAELAKAYIAAGILGSASYADASHVAIATIAEADIILSWNFKHIVNYDRIRKFNAVNLMHGYRAVDIRSPQELAYDNKD